MNNKINWNVIIVFLLFANLILIGYIIFVKINSEGSQCLIDPLPFGYKKLQEVNKYPLYCSCFLSSQNPAPSLHFNSSGVWFEQPEINPTNIPDLKGLLNFSFN